MKSLQCDRCEVVIEGETFDVWMENAHPHWMEAHADIVESMKLNPNAKEEMARWMVETRERFEAAGTF